MMKSWGLGIWRGEAQGFLYLDRCRGLPIRNISAVPFVLLVVGLHVFVSSPGGI